MEAGTRRILPEHAARLDEALGTEDFFARNCEVSNRSRYPDHFAEAAEAEAMAETIKEYAPLLIPGLLQTEAYAREVFRAYHPTAPETAIDELVEARLDRARLLADPTRRPASPRQPRLRQTNRVGPTAANRRRLRTSAQA